MFTFQTPSQLYAGKQNTGKQNTGKDAVHQCEDGFEEDMEETRSISERRHLLKPESADEWLSSQRNGPDD